MNANGGSFVKDTHSSCGNRNCIKLEHISPGRKKKEVDLKKAWELLLAKTTAIDDCLVMKKVGPSGYGATTLGGIKMGSHRASFIINKNGGKPIPDRDECGNMLVVRHLCHKQRGCINPLHLELGTQSQNAYEDRIDAGTHMFGEKSPMSTISEDTAQKIKNSLRDIDDPDYLTKKKRAGMFRTTVDVVESIDYNRAWAHLPNRFGEVRPNTDKRLKSMERQRLGREREWSQSDFEDAAEMLKKNIVESEEFKAGSFPPGPCWLWQLSKDPKGYSRACFNGRRTQFHILSLESRHKRFSKPEEVVRHLCNVKACCNPDHLRFGTRKDNAIDVQLTGTSKAFKLDASKVRMIRESNASSSALATTLGVHKESIVNVRKGKTWASIV
jgi:hypothetical protein